MDYFLAIQKSDAVIRFGDRPKAWDRPLHLGIRSNQPAFLCSGPFARSDRHGSDSSTSTRDPVNGADSRRIVGFALFTYNGGRGDGVPSKGEPI
jgi:hypothetical protein